MRSDPARPCLELFHESALWRSVEASLASLESWQSADCNAFSRYVHRIRTLIVRGTPGAKTRGMPQDAVVPVPKSRRKFGLLAPVLVLVLAGAGIFLWLELSPSATARESAGPAATVPLETFVVNLSGTGQRGYLRVGISLGLSRAASPKEDAIAVALVRDTILTVLSNAQPEQLLQAEGKRQLKAEILRAVQERVPQLGVEDVYFTEFLVQM